MLILVCGLAYALVSFDFGDIRLNDFPHISKAGNELSAKVNGLSSQIDEKLPGKISDQIQFNKKSAHISSSIDGVSLHMFDVGEGLSVLVDYKDTEVLIDGGYSEYGDDIVKDIKPYVNGDIEYVIGTHSHADHVGGLAEIIKDYQVDKTIYGDTGTSKSFKDFENAAKNEPNSNWVQNKDETVKLADGLTMETFDVFDEDDNTNNNSVVTLFDTGGVKILVMGDAEDKAEGYLLDKMSHVDILVVGHHGSETSSSEAFLDKTTPTYGLISSAGPEYQYNNPDRDVIRRLASHGTQIYGTYKSGGITATVHKGGITLSPPVSDELTPDNYDAPY